MGLFSSKKITYVASVTYNLAGDEAERPKYIKALVLQNITSRSNDSLAETLRYGYLGGPQMDFRAFYRWCKDNYKTIGIPAAQINGFEAFNNSVITSQLPAKEGYTPYLQNVQRIEADYTSWAEQYILANRPEAYTTAWESFMQDDGQIFIQYEDGTSVLFTPTNFNKGAYYLYILYTYIKENQSEPTVTGETIVLDQDEQFPSTTDWSVDYDVTNAQTVSLNKNTTVEKSYSDGSPTQTSETNETSTSQYSKRMAHYMKTEYLGQDPNSENTRLLSRKSDMYFMTNHVTNQTTNTTTSTEIVNGVTVTTKTTVVQDTFSVIRTHRTDTTDTVVSEFKDQTLWLYRIGSNQNAALENMINNPARIQGEFFPPMPIRLDNRFISDTYYPVMYKETAKAYKKLMGKKFSEFIDTVADNPNLGDIDYAFITFGVSLNVKETACKKYLYKFFQNLRATQVYGDAQWAAFQTQLKVYQAWVDAWAKNPEVTPSTMMSLPSVRSNTIRIASNGTQNIPYDIRMSWVNITENSGSGLGKAGAKKGDMWFERRPDITWSQYAVRSQRGMYDGPDRLSLYAADTKKLQVIRLYWQTEDNAFIYLELYGLSHTNYVYNGKSVDISAGDALADTEESGFVVPMHYATMKDMSLKDSTQMATACVFVVFNCYVVKKQKWYQRGIFKFLFVIVFAIVAAVFTGGAGFGLLGANLAVGSAMGFTGITAAIAGSVANALAAVVLTQIIGFASTAIFGEQWGALIGAIISFVVFNVAAAFQQGGGLAGIDWGSMMRAENLLKLTDVLSQGYSAYMGGITNNLTAQTQSLIASYEEQSKNIQQLWGKNIGYSDIVFNPEWITKSNVSYSYEGSSTFLTRTLMTGTDIAQMSHDMLTDYAKLNLMLPTVYG